MNKQRNAAFASTSSHPSTSAPVGIPGFSIPPLREVKTPSKALPLPVESELVKRRREIRAALTDRDRTLLLRIFAIRNRRRTPDTVTPDDPPDFAVACPDDGPSFELDLPGAEVTVEVPKKGDEERKKSFSEELLEAFASCPADLFGSPQQLNVVDDEVLYDDVLLDPFSPPPTESVQNSASTPTNGELMDFDEIVPIVERGIESLMNSVDEVGSGDGGRTTPVPGPGTDDEGSDTDSSGSGNDSDTGTVINTFQSRANLSDVTSSDDDESDAGTVIFVKDSPL